MSNPEQLIDQYLDRVKIYLPANNEEILTEIRTHLLLEAENIGEGRVSQGSIILAIERFGEPKTVANEYSGIRKRAGFIPEEYVYPVIRLFLFLTMISVTLVASVSLVGMAYPALQYLFPIIIGGLPFMLVINILIAVVIIGGLSISEVKSPTERTLIEHILGIGLDTFNPKSKGELIGSVIFGLVFPIILFSPFIQGLLFPSFLHFLPIFTVVLLIEAIISLIQLLKNQTAWSLVPSIFVHVAWISVGILLLGTAWPVQYVVALQNGVWVAIDLATLFASTGFAFPFFETLWIFIVWIIIATNIGGLLTVISKISLKIQEK